MESFILFLPYVAAKTHILQCFKVKNRIALFVSLNDYVCIFCKSIHDACRVLIKSRDELYA